MSNEAKRFVLGMLLGAASGSAACAVFAHFFFESHVMFASIVGAVVGALAGPSGETITESIVVCLINTVLIWIALTGFSKAKAPSSTHQIIILLLVSALLGGAIGRLAGAFTKKP